MSARGRVMTVDAESGKVIPDKVWLSLLKALELTAGVILPVEALPGGLLLVITGETGC